MVEIAHIFKKTWLPAVAATILAGGALAQQPVVEARIRGLEGNPRYMSLLRADEELKIRKDSIRSAVEDLRLRVQEDPSLSDEILRLESLFFKCNSESRRLADSINLIEQSWVAEHYDRADQASGGEGAEAVTDRIPDAEKRANLVYNDYFRRQLEPRDLDALRRAQELEQQALSYMERFQTNHATLSELAAAYTAAQTEEEALKLFDSYSSLDRETRLMTDSLSQTWDYIFDNKDYAYSYLADKMAWSDLITAEENRLSEARRKFAALSEHTASEAVTDYLLRKRVMLAYEQSVAETLRLDAARDSLQSAMMRLAELELVPAAIVINERLFLDYEEIEFSPTSKYTTKNPIPECRVYARGTIYRILLGTFNTKRAASLFRGTSPLCYQIDDRGKWCYYAGGFATKDEAEAAQKKLKARGFMRPEIVMWTDSVAHNLTREPDLMKVSYRIEITSTEDLSPAVKEVITSTGEGRELSRVGHEIFIIGLFDDRAIAERLAEAITATEPDLKIKVTEFVSKPE